MKLLPYRKGFTIVEIAVAIVVLGILASIVAVSHYATQRRASDTEVQGDLRQAAMRIEAHKASVGGYPATQGDVDGGELPKSVDERVYTYTRPTSRSYCLSAVSIRTGTVFRVTNSSTEVIEGSC